jgi:hypothetical protein
LFGVRGVSLKTLYCNSLEVSHTREVFLLILRFVSPDQHEETVYVTVSPSGAVALHDILEKEVESYVKVFGNIVAGDWKTDKDCSNSGKNEKASYLS